MTLRERFDAKYAINPETGCWEWTATRRDTGYGQVWSDGRLWPAHRVAYELYVGEIPTGLALDHLCRVRHCVNPAHLEPVTSRVNTLRGEGPTAVNATKTSCDNGHPFDETNTQMRPDGKRECRPCHRERQRSYAARLGDEYRRRRNERDRARARAKREERP